MYKIFQTNLDDEILNELGDHATFGQATQAMLGYAASKIREILEAHKSDKYLDDALEEIMEETYIRAAATDANGVIDYSGESALLVYQSDEDDETPYFGKSNPYFLYYLYVNEKIEVFRYYISTGKFEKNQ